MSTVIKVENLSKKYTLRHQQTEQYLALRDVITNGVKNFSKKVFSPFTSNDSPLTETQEEFWALKDVSFEVKQGDRVGIIGRNGAGKSTLLKVLSRITEPTQGRITIKGRVASLLEVGTGFHPELTGRENIFLNGAILGMSRADIKLKFDEIVAFAEVEKFLDTPVKRYSSGMYVRLAFAVAAHLEPEILIVDEVLAVGDAQFQKKCLGKMEDVGKEGRTVLFVSHNIAMVKNLCSRGLVLENGYIICDSAVVNSISTYIKSSVSDKNTELDSYIRDGISRINFNIFDINDSVNNQFLIGKEIRFVARLNVDRPVRGGAFGIGIISVTGERVITFHTSYQYRGSIDIDSVATIKFTWLHNILCPSNYHITAALYEGGQLISSWDNIGIFTILESDYFETGQLPTTSHQGYVLNKVNISIEKN